MERKEAAADAIVRPSQRCMSARASLPPRDGDPAEGHPPQAPSPSPSSQPDPAPQKKGNGGYTADQTKKRDMWVFSRLEGAMTMDQLETATGLSASSVKRALDSLKEMDAVIEKDRLWSVKPGAATHLGWSETMLSSLEFPGRARYRTSPTPADDSNAGKANGKDRGKVRDDALVRLMNKTDPLPSDNEEAYRTLYEAVAHLPLLGVKEVDDVTKAFGEAIRRRLGMVRHDCPLCGRALEVTYTRIRCRRCSYVIDTGDLQSGLRLASLMERRA